MEYGERWLANLVEWLVLFVEGAAALIIFAGCVLAFGRLLVGIRRAGRAEAFVRVRLILGRFLALGLEFQLASDLLRTAVAPSFEHIGKLAAVAAIRTALNFFLEREIARERREISARADSTSSR
jgi:uncharacterized membrane protein